MSNCKGPRHARSTRRHAPHSSCTDILCAIAAVASVVVGCVQLVMPGVTPAMDNTYNTYVVGTSSSSVSHVAGCADNHSGG